MALQSTYNPSLSVVTTKKTVAKSPLLRTVDKLVKQEKTKQQALAQLHQADEVVLQADFIFNKINYKHRLIAKGEGYALREKRQATLQEHLHSVLSELSSIQQKVEHQWVLSICQGVLNTQPPERLALVLLEQALRFNKHSLRKTKKQLIYFSQWLKRQTVGYQHTNEGQRLADIIELLQFKQTKPLN